MALKKSIELPSKVTVEYWKLAVVRFDYLTDECRVLIFGYLNKEARDEGASPAHSIDDLVSWGAESRADVYDKIKAEFPLFDGAEDI
jgi:hypothetical protein